MSEFKPLSKAVRNGKYHECFNVCENGMRPLVNYKQGETCYLATNEPFWKHAKDVCFKIQTRAQKAKNIIVKREDIINYLSA